MTEIRIVSDLKEAERLWRALSPGQTIFDEWDWRYCFYKHKPWPLCFIAAFIVGGGTEPTAAIGLLPLQWHPDGFYEFFAEDPCEENRAFIKSGYEKIIPELYAAIPGPATCYDISGEDEFTRKLPLEDYKYILPLSGFKNSDDFLQARFSAKRRQGITREIAALEENKIRYSVYGLDIFGGLTDSFVQQAEADLELLFSFNNNNFNEESYLKEEERAAWRDLLKLPFDWRISVTEINGVRAGVYLNVVHNDYWHCLISGVNFKNWPGLGKYSMKANIGAAIAAGAGIFDAGLGDCGWKHIWHFDTVPQYEFIKES